MPHAATFDEVLDAVESLSDEAQRSLVEVVRRKLAERGRARVLQDVKEAEAELQSGMLQPMTVDEIMREIES